MKYFLVGLVALCAIAFGASGTKSAAMTATVSVSAPTAPAGTYGVYVPSGINVQGKVTPVPTPSPQTVTFTLSTTPSGSSGDYWHEDQSVSFTSDGLFSVQLGTVSPITSIPEAGICYLKLKIAGQDVLPPTQLFGVPYAWNAAGLTSNQDGICRAGVSNALYGDDATKSTHVNLGIGSTTGTSGVDNSFCTVAGGSENVAGGDHATVGGGWKNQATGAYATISGGGGPCGYINVASGASSAVGGGYDNAASGDYTVVSGGVSNSATATASTVAGGEANQATTANASVGGGSDNLATGYSATIGGGFTNTADGYTATIAGGSNNAASGGAGGATVGGGAFNAASGQGATVPGGYHNAAVGDFSFAAGHNAKSQNQGCFTWSDNTGTDLVNATDNRWVARAQGGVYFYTNAAATVGSYLPAGGNSWQVICDRANKENFRPVDRKALLERLARMPVQEWNLKSQDPRVRHIGPVAQDFHAAFGYGESDKSIGMSDMDGVTLAAIQALYEQNQELRRELEALEARLPAPEK